MNDPIEIRPIIGPVNAQIRPPGSKSITNRALLIAAIARGSSTLSGVLESDDTKVMVESLRRLGLGLQVDQAQEKIVVVGCEGNFPNKKASLDVENSGTTIRFLTAVLGIKGGEYRLDGVERMRERPIGPLVDALNSLGADIAALSPNQSPPVVIRSKVVSGGLVKIRGDLSSQYLSGLLMAGPLVPQGLKIEIEGELVSKPYVLMTIKMMESFGVRCKFDKALTRFEIAGSQVYTGCAYQIEPDASAASYFWATAAICGGTATVCGLNEESLQGDIRFVRVLELMGCKVNHGPDFISVTGPALYGIDVDMGDISDTVQTLAVVAAFVKGPTRVRNVAHNRLKETDRIAFLAIELRRLGLQIDEFEDGLQIHPGQLHGAKLETYNDHRMAMSLALFGLRVPGLKISNPACVSKTYPDFFSHLQSFCRSK